MRYLLYAKAGHEFEVRSALAEIGVQCDLPVSLEKKRVGRKKREVTFYDKPYLPNFLFAKIPDQQFTAVANTKHVAGTMTVIQDKEWRQVQTFLDRVAKDYSDRDRERQNLDAPVWEFEPGQALELLSGSFQGRMATFRRMVERPHDLHAKVVAEVEFMGRTVTAEIDPLDVKEATG